MQGAGQSSQKGLKRPIWSEVLHTKSTLGLLGVKAEGLEDIAVRLYFNLCPPQTKEQAPASQLPSVNTTVDLAVSSIVGLQTGSASGCLTLRTHTGFSTRYGQW